jgi:Xaa-Pro aminopeptidase
MIQNVHEGPMGIGTRLQYSEVGLNAGNVLSDGKSRATPSSSQQLTITEPGYYEDGNFGIRIENIIMAHETSTNHKFGDKPWLGFEHVTMVPMCQKLIDPSLLTADEKQWLNDYHREVWEKTSGFFKNDERTTRWLKCETAPV